MINSTLKIVLVSIKIIISLIITILIGYDQSPPTLISYDQSPPTIINGEFPFHFKYELNGKIYDINDTVVCEFSGFDISGGFGIKERSWDENLKSGTDRISILSDYNVHSILHPKRIDAKIEVFLDYGLGDYYMDDPNANSLIHGKPRISYLEAYYSSPKILNYELTPLTDKQLQEHFGINIIDFTFSIPIDNTFK